MGGPRDRCPCLAGAVDGHGRAGSGSSRRPVRRRCAPPRTPGRLSSGLPTVSRPQQPRRVPPMARTRQTAGCPRPATTQRPRARPARGVSWPWVAALAGVALLLSLPGLVRAVRRRRRLAGGPEQAFREVVDTARDVGVITAGLGTVRATVEAIGRALRVPDEQTAAAVRACGQRGRRTWLRPSRGPGRGRCPAWSRPPELDERQAAAGDGAGADLRAGGAGAIRAAGGSGCWSGAGAGGAGVGGAGVGRRGAGGSGGRRGAGRSPGMRPGGRGAAGSCAGLPSR